MERQRGVGRSNTGKWLVDKTTEQRDDTPMETPQVHGLRRPIYLMLALFFLVLGILGVLLPGIPATPFLLLMSYFLVRVSPKLHAWVMRWPVVGPPLKDWDAHRGIRMHVKLTAWTMVVIVITLTVYFGNLPTWADIAIVILAAIGIYVVWRIPSIVD